MVLFLRGAEGLSFELGARGQETLGTASRCSLVCPVSSGLEPEHAQLRQVGDAGSSKRPPNSNSASAPNPRHEWSG